MQISVDLNVLVTVIACCRCAHWLSSMPVVLLYILDNKRQNINFCERSFSFILFCIWLRLAAGNPLKTGHKYFGTTDILMFS